MPRIPIEDMSYKRGKLPEAVEYALEETLPDINRLSDKIAALENKQNSDILQMLADKIEAMEKKEDLLPIVNLLADKLAVLEQPEFCNEINNISLKLDASKEAIVAITQKLDGEDVTDLDTDYEATVNAKLL